MRSPFLILLALSPFLCTCDSAPKTLFEPVAGIDFENTIPENDSINILVYEYLFNGGGVGVGDFDNNGLPDLIFSGNYVSSRIYLQTEPWEFTDVTEAAGLTTNVWCAGVNVHDIDGNGYEDIYFATLNPNGDNDTPNLLFLNDGPGEAGTPKFREAAAAYGLDDPSYSTHSAWIDIENDGDLDLYVLNNGIENFNRNVAKGTDTLGKGKSRDNLYIREGDGFAKSPLKTEGWGLGLAIQDFNHDGFPDIYVGNDFLSNDFLLINQRDGTFTDELRQRIPHTSRNAMGVDVADINGDGRPEIMTVDMLPDDNMRRKTMFGDIPHQSDRTERARGYSQQYIRNTLQLANANGTYSDVAFQAGVAATDWSWTPLIADFDNDGARDIFVSNGYPKDITNKDFIDFSDRSTQFGTTEAQLRIVNEALLGVSGVHQPNFFFRNVGELAFDKVNWLPELPTYSNGAVFVDLDRDGDLDLVTNNINEPAGIFRNYARERSPETSHYFSLDLEGPEDNPDALGTKVWLTIGDTTLYHEHYRQRGYLSTVDRVIHFGLGRREVVGKLRIRWPDGSESEKRDVPVDQILKVEFAAGGAIVPIPENPRIPAMVAKPVLNGPVHQESAYSDFDVFPLAIRDFSQAGPAMLSIDVDDDDIDELVFGGAAGQSVSIWRQDDTGALSRVQNFENTIAGEVTALASLRSSHYDDDEDIFVGFGSSEFSNNEELWKDKLYLNHRGFFSPDTVAIKAPPMPTTSASAKISKSRGYPIATIKTGISNGISGFDDVGGLYNYVSVGHHNPSGKFYSYSYFKGDMILDIVCEDFDRDGKTEIATSGYFCPVRFFEIGPDTIIKNKALPRATENGWYYSLTPIDLDGDGDLDLVAGNVGLNTPYQVDADHPLTLRADDYDDNGTIDPIITAYDGEVAYPIHPRNTLGRQLPSLKRQITDYSTYGGWTAANLPPVSDEGVTLEAKEFRSLYLENDGAGNFTVRPLPALAQTAPLRDALEITLEDGRPALICVQNDYAVEPLGGRFDAGTGFLLYLDDAGELVVDADAVHIPQDARSIVRLRTGDGEDMILIGVNGGPVHQLRLPTSRSGK